MNDKQIFINAGFSVLNTENTENKLAQFIKEHYPSVLKDGELNLAELKAVLGLPIDEKVNGYGLNFVGRGVARAKYAQETQKEFLLNRKLSKNADTTQNMVLKGDNLDSLKLLKPHYSGKIKCIYIDPPYNTSSDEFVYPDKFDRHEAEVLGIAENLSDEDFDRMEFSFKTKKSHNGWLAFMYPRLLLARDLLSKDGVIFISIDDNEQANLKILCDEIFGEENFVANIPIYSNPRGRQSSKNIAESHEYVIVYQKTSLATLNGEELTFEQKKEYSKKDNKGIYREIGLRLRGGRATAEESPSLHFPIYVNPVDETIHMEEQEGYIRLIPTFSNGTLGTWRWSKSKILKDIDLLLARKVKRGDTFEYDIFEKDYLTSDKNRKVKSIWLEKEINYDKSSVEQKELFEEKYFDYAKPIYLLQKIIKIATNPNDIILDFFAGSGTTGHAVMALNAEDGGNRKFILCQIDEPIAKNKPAYQFCKDNGLEPVISSITIERLKRVSSPPALSA